MKKIKRIAVLSLAVAWTAFAAACSDGELKEQGPAFDIAPPPPIIISFYATPEEVPAGGTATIAWEVAGADSVEITATSDGAALSSFHVESEELTGSAPAANLTATTDFVLTARKTVAVPAASAPAPAADTVAPAAPETPPAAPSESSVSQTITVRVIPAAGISVSAHADSTSLTAGQKTILRWEVAPSDATVEVKDASGEDVTPTFAGADCEGTDVEVLLANGTPMTGPQAAGCAVVDPTATTTYRVNATKEGAQTQTAEVTINVTSTGGAPQATIQVNGSEHAQVTGEDAEVTVSWTAAGPAGATVTVTATPAAQSCTPALPQNAAVTDNMLTNSRCRLSALPTTFTIELKAAADAEPVRDSADVSQGQGSVVRADVDIVSDQWAFAGEEVTLTITPRAGTNRASIREIRIADKTSQGGTKVVSGIPQGPVKVTVPETGVSVTAVDTAGGQHPYGVKVVAIPMVMNLVAGSDEDILVTELTLDPNNPANTDAVRNRFTGIKMADYNEGKVDIYIDGSNEEVIDVQSPLRDRIVGTDETKQKWWSVDDFASHVGALSTNAIKVRPSSSNEVYVGVTGAVFRSTDGGNNFSLVMPLYKVSEEGVDYPGQHPSCRGKTQTGFPYARYNQLLALKQACDIVVGKSGRLIVATDISTYSISNIEGFMNNDPAVVIKGRTSELYRKTTDALVCLDDDCNSVFAGSEDGVYKSTDGGETWEKFGSLDTKVFSLAILGDKLYAGTGDITAGTGGIYESSISSASFRAVGLQGKKVYALAIDHNIGPFGTTIIAGTDSGVFVTRDTGTNWSQISSFGTGESLAVATESSEAPDNTKKISVLVGVGRQSFFGEVPVARAGSGTPAGNDSLLPNGITQGRPTVTVPSSLTTFTIRQ